MSAARAKAARPRRGRGPMIVGITAGVAALFLGAIAVRAILAPKPPSTTAVEYPEVPGGILELGDPGSSGITAAGGLLLQLTDKEDPTRLAMQMHAKRMDPTARDTYSVTDLRTWVYQNNGTRLWIRADEGTLVLPDRSREPESGRLVGNVIIRRFKDPAPGVEIDPEADVPEVTVRTHSLVFDQLGEVSTVDRVVVTTPDGEIAGTGLRILVNETRERIMLLRLMQGEYLRVRVASDEPSDSNDATPEPPSPSTVAQGTTPTQDPSTPATDPASNDPTAPTTAAAAPTVETMYRATFEREVVFHDGPRSVSGDRLEVWARLFDNTLRPGAIGELSAPDQPSESARDRSTPPSSAVARGDEPATTPDSSGTPTDNPDDTRIATSDGVPPEPEEPREFVELTWTGPLEIRPLIEASAELEHNDVAARFTAERTGLVRLADESAGATGSAGEVEYYATTRDLVLGAPSAEGVRLETTDGDKARFGRLELSLATGIGFVPGPGVVESATAGRVEWREQADLTFRTENGTMTSQLIEADCAGGARASHDGAYIEGDFLNAYFRPSREREGESELTKLVARDAVRLSDGRGGEGRADSLDVFFKTIEGEASPTDFIAVGKVRFSDDPDFIEGGLVEARLGPDENGDLTVTWMHAMEDVLLERRRDGIVVRGSEVEMDAKRQNIEAAGPGAVVQRLGARISGDIVRLDGIAMTAEVVGRGAFQYRSREQDGSVASVDAEWTRGMTFDDATGVLICDGDVVATHQPDPYSRDVVIADAVRADLVPRSAGAVASADDDSGLMLAPRGEETRDLRRFIAIAGPDDDWAAIEAARYEPDVNAPEGRRLVRSLRLKGLEINADNVAGTIDVPTRGELLVSDQRIDSSGNDDDRGSALFAWSSSMHFDRPGGRATLEGDASMVHKRLDGGVTVVMGATLVADVTASSGDPTVSSSLRRAWASGLVSARSGDRELVADELSYDAERGQAEAYASPGHRVTILDTRTGTPSRAQRIFWDMRADRIEIDSPSRLDTSR